MKLIKWEPFGEIDRFFDEMPVVSIPKFGWDMAVDLYEKEGNIVAKMSLPGIEPENINVTINEDILRISGSREEEKEEKDKHYYSKEIRKGSFERSIGLPKSIDKAKVNAEYKNGTLQVTMPITETSKETPVKIKIEK